MQRCIEGAKHAKNCHELHLLHVLKHCVSFHSPEGCFRMVLSLNVALQCLLVVAHAVKHL